MPSYIQIGDDPTKWWLVQPFNASQLSGQPLNLNLAGPLNGILVLSGKSASVALFDEPNAASPSILNPSVGAIYLPTATGPSAAHFGYALPPTANVDNLASQIVTAMRDGTRQAITLYGGGTLVLNGATMSFVVIQPGAIGGSQPHG
jgi:hypothetical protein